MSRPDGSREPLRGLVGAGPSKVSVDRAMRARDVSRPGEEGPGEEGAGEPRADEQDAEEREADEQRAGADVTDANEP